jgi:hypothetical protein
MSSIDVNEKFCLTFIPRNLKLDQRKKNFQIKRSASFAPSIVDKSHFFLKKQKNTPLCYHL